MSLWFLIIIAVPTFIQPTPFIGAKHLIPKVKKEIIAENITEINISQIIKDEKRLKRYFGIRSAHPTEYIMRSK